MKSGNLDQKVIYKRKKLDHHTISTLAPYKKKMVKHLKYSKKKKNQGMCVSSKTFKYKSID